MLKAEFHTHCNLDPEDTFIKYSPEDLIDRAAKLNYQILALTCHNKVIHTKELEDYAKNKNILLIPGIEKTINNQHVLIYNITNEEAQKINSLEDLKILKNKKIKQNEEILIIAPHPFHPGKTCLKNNILKHLNLFDAWEYSFFYTNFWNPNKKTKKLAKKNNKTLIANSDVHEIDHLGKVFSLIDCEKNIKSIFNAIKKDKIKLKIKPLKNKIFFKIFFEVFISKIKHQLKLKV